MTYFNIRHLASQLGSNKISYSKFELQFPKWNMSQVKQKTGMNFIYESKKNETVLELSLRSSKKTLSGFDKNKVDCIVVVTQTPKNKLPSVSCVLQDRLKLHKKIIAFDINMGCSGFIYALASIHSLINAGFVKNVLLVCSDTYTKYIDKNTRTCRSVFSDSASSCIVSKCNLGFKPSFNFYTVHSFF